jgi:hypothetical protein
MGASLSFGLSHGGIRRFIPKEIQRGKNTFPSMIVPQKKLSISREMEPA